MKSLNHLQVDSAIFFFRVSPFLSFPDLEETFLIGLTSHSCMHCLLPQHRPKFRPRVLFSTRFTTRALNDWRILTSEDHRQKKKLCTTHTQDLCFCAQFNPSALWQAGICWSLSLHFIITSLISDAVAAVGGAFFPLALSRFAVECRRTSVGDKLQCCERTSSCAFFFVLSLQTAHEDVISLVVRI